MRPAPAIALAIDRPMPRDAPVISTRLPCSSMAHPLVGRHYDLGPPYGRPRDPPRRPRDRSPSSPSTGRSAATPSTTRRSSSCSTPTAARAAPTSSCSPGAGGHFCAGADLSGVEDRSFTDLLRARPRSPSATTRARSIAACDGAALGRRHAAGGGVRPPRGHRRPPGSASPPPSSGWRSTTGPSSASQRLAGAGPARAMLLAAETYGGDEALRAGPRPAPRRPRRGAGVGRRDRRAGPAHHRRPQGRAQPPRDGRSGRGDDPDVQAASDRGVGERGPPGGHRRLPRAPPPPVHGPLSRP